VSFLGAAFLFALPLAAAPIVLHLFDRQRSVVIQWGAMQFLVEAATRKTSARRLRQWLLLLLRVAAIAALVFALARPLAPGRWLGGAQRSETILVLDNSLSTQREANGRTAFAELQTRADEALNALSPGDAVRLMVTSPYATWVTPASVRIDAASLLALRDQLRELRPTAGAGDLRAALLKAVQADAADETFVERRVVLLTDGRRANWKIDDAEGWRRFREALAAARLPTRVESIEVGEIAVERGNVAVNRLRAGRALVGAHQPLTITAELQNYSTSASKPSALAWSIGGKTLGETHVPSLAPGQRQDIVWRHAFDRIGAFAVSCRLDAQDDLPADNRAALVVEVVDRVPVLLVEGAEHLAELQQDAYLVRAALGRIEGENSGDYRAVFEPRTISPERLETIDLDEFRAVVIPNFTAISGQAVERLSQFVAQGGGLWLALGPRTDVGEFNKRLFNDGDGLSPVAIDEAINEIVDESAARQEDKPRTTINPFQKSHPATAELADDERLDTGEVKISRRFRFRKSAAARDMATLLDLTNGEPLAVERRLGRGRVIVQGIPLAMPWSDLAVSQAFVVMVHDWLGYLGEPKAVRHNLAPGEPISLSVAGAEQGEATLTTPAGDVAVTGEPAEGGLTFRTSRTMLPGDYSLEIGVSGDAIAFHVARDPIESDLTSLFAADRTILAEAAGLGGDAGSMRIASNSPREPLSPLLLMALVALIAGELWLSGATARQRFGVDEISETSAQWEIETSRSSFASLSQPEASTLNDTLPGASRTTAAPVEQEIAAGRN
jgi:hypothetical protein